MENATSATAREQWQALRLSYTEATDTAAAALAACNANPDDPAAVARLKDAARAEGKALRALIEAGEPRAVWDAAFAAWEAAKVAYDFAEAAYETAHKEAGEDADQSTAVSKLATMLDQSAAVENDTRFALILTPAPDMSAALWKLRSLYADEDDGKGEYTSDWRREYPLAVIADLERLQSEYAEAWLAAWTADGGSVVIDDDGKVQIGWATYDYSPNYRAPDPAWPEAVRDHSYICGQAAHDATMKARYEAIRMIPGGVDALKAHMRANGIRVAVSKGTDQ
jgi:hypothetical protein